MLVRGGSRIFSRGGGFSKKIRKFWRPFFLGRPNWFLELSQSTFLPLFWQNFLRRRQISEKTVKNSQSFEKILTKNRVFFGIYCGAQGAFRKINGRSAKNGFLKKYQRGDPLGRQGVESLRGGRLGRTPPPLNPPLMLVATRSQKFPKKQSKFQKLGVPKSVYFFW